jgi:hypothetical protein
MALAVFESLPDPSGHYNFTKRSKVFCHKLQAGRKKRKGKVIPVTGR